MATHDRPMGHGGVLAGVLSCALGALLSTASLLHPALADECAEVPGLTGSHSPPTAWERANLTEAELRAIEMMVHLNYPGVRRVILDCPPGKSPSLTMSWEGTYPPASFFDFVAKAGAVISDSTAENVRAGAVKCHQRELSTKDSMDTIQSEVLAHGVLIECAAGRTPVTFITVYEGRWSSDPSASMPPQTQPRAGSILPGPGVTGRDAMGK